MARISLAATTVFLTVVCLASAAQGGPLDRLKYDQAHHDLVHVRATLTERYQDLPRCRKLTPAAKWLSCAAVRNLSATTLLAGAHDRFSAYSDLVAGDCRKTLREQASLFGHAGRAFNHAHTVAVSVWHHGLDPGEYDAAEAALGPWYAKVEHSTISHTCHSGD